MLSNTTFLIFVKCGLQRDHVTEAGTEAPAKTGALSQPIINQ